MPSSRRSFLTRLGQAISLVALAGCDRLSSSPWFTRLLDTAEPVTRAAQRTVAPSAATVREYTAADLSPVFPVNGTADPDNDEYQTWAAAGFAGWSLRVGGLVERPASLSLDEIRALPARTQITRHDCVEGWSAIAKWTGAHLGALLNVVGLQPAARYVVFHCADPMDALGTRYYESIALDDAYHPQTILAYEMNDRLLPVAHGAPLRLRLERQLGYKMAKYVMGLDVVARLDTIAGGRGGYWEDQGYEWYAGI